MWTKYNKEDRTTFSDKYGKYEVYSELSEKQWYCVWNTSSWAYGDNGITYYRKIISPFNKQIL